jgi:uncharacterized membrane protein
MATMDHWLFGLTLVTAIGSGLMAGVFFAFSTFVMKALARLPAHEGIAAMQSINVAVINPMFLGAFLGTAVACAAEIVCVGVCWQRSGAAYLLAGAALYLVGTFFVTMRCNVPLNNSLAAISPSGPDAAEHWAHYVRRWTAWNHVRTIAAAAASAAFTIALGC